MEEKSWGRRTLVKKVFLQNEEVCPKMNEKIYLYKSKKFALKWVSAQAKNFGLKQILQFCTSVQIQLKSKVVLLKSIFLYNFLFHLLQKETLIWTLNPNLSTFKLEFSLQAFIEPCSKKLLFDPIQKFYKTVHQ